MFELLQNLIYEINFGNLKNDKDLLSKINYAENFFLKCLDFFYKDNPFILLNKERNVLNSYLQIQNNNELNFNTSCQNRLNLLKYKVSKLMLYYQVFF